jgi:nitrogenase molybdenum-iron protein alpha/beta subunit
VRDAVTVVHGPKGCAHHNFSLLHTTGLDNDELILPDIISTGLAETEIIFGGEEALAGVLTSVVRQDPAAVFVLSTCIVDTIGDDVQEVCGRDYGVPIIRVPTAGFLGGTFQDGLNRALCAIAAAFPPRRPDSAATCARGPCVNIIGEKISNSRLRRIMPRSAGCLTGWISGSISDISGTVRFRISHAWEWPG